MARWEPNARERLQKAAMELYRERGFDETAVADIAARAGLTERTFFRHFTDKREVLFGGSSALEELVIGKIASAPDSMPPLDNVARAFEGTSPMFEERRAFAKARQAIITAHAGLQERELIKLASLAAAIARALRKRGVSDPTATLAAESGIAVFKLAFERWVGDDKKMDLAHHVRESLAQLKEVTAGDHRADAVTPRKRRRRSPKPGASKQAE
jgi:AcrR family transcriptional regulator